MKGMFFALTLGLSIGAMAANNVWYVDASNYGQGGDGSKTNPFGSMQEANDATAVQNDDTIYVSEGDYDQGKTAYGNYSHGTYSGSAYVRLAVSKRLNFVASGRRNRTRIVGYPGSQPTRTSSVVYFMCDSIGCVAVTQSGSGSTFRGFTFHQGTQHQSANGAMASGGITAVSKSGAEFTAIDCLFDACIGRGGGGMGEGGVAIRCTFAHCGGNGYGSAANGIRGYNCLFLRNGRLDDETQVAMGDYASAVYNCELVNCLVFANGFHNGIRGNGATYDRYYNVAAYDDDDNAAYVVTNGTFRSCAVREVMGAGADSDATVVQLYSGVNQEDILFTNLCANAYTGDYSPVKNGFLDGTGNPSYRDLNWIPAVERDVCFDGTPMPADAPTPIGLLLPAKTVTSGPLPFGDSKLTVNGMKILKPSLHNAIYQGAWPEQVAIRVAPGETKVTGYAEYGRPRFAGKDTIWQLLPPKHNADGTLYAPPAITALEYECEYWVDCAYEGDDADGSAEKPFPKLQSALDRLVNSKETLIHVAKGTYGSLQGFTPAAAAGGVNSRIVVPASKCAVVLAEEGPENTIIEGARATEGTTGNGTDAVRCIYAGSGADVAFCGFTIADGHVYGDNDTENSTYCGGAVCCANLSPQFYDSVITGSSGRHAVWNGKYFRCRLVRNDNYRRGIVSGSTGNCFVSGSLFADNIDKGGTYGSLFAYVYSFNCSFAETNAPADRNVWNINCRVLNAAVYARGIQNDPNSDGEMIGCVGASSRGSAMRYSGPDNLNANPQFFNMMKGDYRLSSTSPALNFGKIKAGVKLTYAYLLANVRGDINNAGLIHDDGTVNAGCYADAGVAQPRQVFVSPTGDDENDGFSEATPKQSLQAACDSATMAKTGYVEDIHEVVALPGTYRIGSKLHAATTFSGAQTIESRVVIPAGMTLRSRDGAEKTIIEGQNATVNADEYGCGDNALRCAYVETNARLVGFTLRNGRTRNTTITGYVDDNLGAGVFGHGADSCSVEDCIVEGCVSRNGAAASMVTLRRCEIRDNCATGWGSVSRSAELYDCYIHGNYGCSSMSDLVKNVVGCTYVGNYSNLAKTDARPVVMSNCGNGRLVNTVLLGGYRDPQGSGGETVSISNCVIGSDVAWTHDPDFEPVGCQDALTQRELLAFYDGTGRALVKEAPGVDTGLAGVCPHEVDLDGARRVMNGAIDIGAFEYDWKNDYGKALAMKNLIVTDVSANGVVETDGVIRMTDGGELGAILSGTEKATYVMRATLAGTGTLVVKLNGAEVGRLTTDGSVTFEADENPADLRYAYMGEGKATLSLLFRKTGMILMVR